MAKPANYPLNIKIGDTETVTVTLQDKDGVPINISGRTYTAQIRESAKSAAVLASFTGSIISAAGGKFSVTLSATNSANLQPANAVWDLQETYGSIVTTLISGTATISRDVTR
jgi:hypothetical protein